ncbi:hypothetical protein CTAYLR_006614 [Chrysophaeum taylorii]|uniref:Uridine/cytidine kinase n=1 Tax=Chrysophaeum taylorii TaxID=2483200 RepID=A0AAD7UL67_9STRA|nr:hypothetical protein CTAYLR_006614 [Chrysophaeum taylorii]
MSKLPFVLGVAGASGSGKSTLASSLERRLKADGLRCVLLREDPRFFKQLSSPSYATRDPQSEEPSHVDWGATEAHARAHLDDDGGGGGVADLIIVEHFLLASPNGGAKHLLPLCDVLLYLDVGADDQARLLCRERRVARSVRRPREVDDLRTYYDRVVWPAFLRNTRDPVTQLAPDARPTVVALDGTRPFHDVLADAIRLVRARVGPRRLLSPPLLES